MNVRVLDPAEDDLRHAARRLESERSGIGWELIASFREAMEQVERFPRFYPLVDDPLPILEVRQALLGRFRYRAVFVVSESETVVIAICHTSRRPGSWHDRIA